MKVTELTKKIHDDYPKVWETIKKKFDLLCVYKDYLSITFYIEDSSFYFKTIISKVEYVLIPVSFNMLYGLLEDFFEEQGILFLYKHFYSAKNEDLYHQEEVLVWDYRIGTHELVPFYQLAIVQNGNRGEVVKRIKTKNEAKQAAILKACDLLNKKTDKE